ncbi:MAG: hypothetical protein F6K18_14270 [Okeania sp. SIO2C2]|uniref:hypothetical protein n=1 Tax=Okeania sp. SIO2C2 TaxID=2607787 RepID=UPI0013B8B7B2|nr:hypothetical protein [Okeania sp. SIO2C2]NEP87889.1 hypothetical protein [Okeania sp. SIO2C2]
MMIGVSACQSPPSTDSASTTPSAAPSPENSTENREQTRPLSLFAKGDGEKPCYNRSTQPSKAVTDLHLHPEPFGGSSIPYEELMNYLDETEVRFVLLYGIGQTLPYNSICTYYLDCVGIDALPGMKNDFENAANYFEFPQDNIHVA